MWRHIEGFRRLLTILIVIAAPFLLLGALLAGIRGALVGLAVALAFEAVAWLVSRPVLLRLCDAVPVNEQQHPELVEIVDRIAATAGIRSPMVAISTLPLPNAMAAVTPRGGVVCVTRGLIEMLPPTELEAVLAHEIAHLTQPGRTAATLAAVVAAIPGAITSAAGGDLYYELPYRRSRVRLWGGRRMHVVRDLIAQLTAPLAAILVRLSTPAQSEFEADLQAVAFTDNHVALSSALRKLQSLAGRIVWPINPAIAHLLVIHPFGCPRLGQLFNTHPPTPERLAALGDRPVR